MLAFKILLQRKSAMRLTACMLASFGFGTLLVAAPFWEKKDFSKWSIQDAKKVLTASPWAKSVHVNMSRLAKEISKTEDIEPNGGFGPGPQVASTSVAGDNGSFLSGDARQASVGQRPLMGRVPPGRIADQSNAGSPQSGELEGIVSQGNSAILEWESAMPLRLAQLKIEAGENQPPQAEIAQVKKPTDVYVVALVGVPGKPQMEEEKEMATAATITPKNKQAIQAISVQEQILSNSTRALIFRFPKTGQITLDDGTVEFRLVKGALPVEVKQTFKLKDMLYKGKLAL